jgi:hypothetical protein
VPAVRPMPPEMIKVVQRMQEMHDELKPLHMTSRPQLQTDFKGQKARVVRSKIHFRPPKETFHEFLINHLLWMLGKSWFEDELAKAPQGRHVVLRWRAQLYDQIREANQQSGTQSGPVAFVPTGDVRALLVFADDIYQVEHAFKTPKKIIRRLRDHEQFQGARYEILTASIFARCGLDIEFIDDKTKKMPEFFATKKAPLERLAAEAKSRHRAGILHHPGSPSEAVALKGDVEGLLREALEQNPGGMPFFVFIDLNLPLTPGIPTELKPWFKDLKDIFDRIEAKSAAAQDGFTGVVFTNFGWHYSRGKGAPGGEYVIVTSFNPRYPVTPETWQLLRRALDEYGFIPDEEQHQKEVRAKYPEFK